MPTVSFNQHFPGYEILGELGRSNARVLKARNQFTGELVAIKHFAINTDAETIRRFQRESEIMTSVNHPNIVKIKEVRLEADLPYIVMELVEGGDLRMLLKKQGRLDIPTTIRLGLQMGQAFKAIHENHIIHRDIKPENIMFRQLSSEELHFLLTDFGIAKLREQSNTVTGTSLMTYEYASPEQFDSPKTVTAATDYYSLGVMLYECLTGKPPFSLVDGRVHTLIKQVMDEPPPQFNLPALPPSLAKLIMQLLAKKETERLKDPSVLIRLLKLAEMETYGEIVTPEPPPPHPPRITRTQEFIQPQPVYPKKKKSVAPGVIITGLILTTAFIIIVTSKKHRDPRSERISSNDTSSFQDTSKAAVPAIDSSTINNNLNEQIADPELDSMNKSDPMLRLQNGRFEDHFENNINGWAIRNDEEREMDIYEEKYRIKGITDGVVHRTLKDFTVDLNKDFTVNLYAKWVTGVTNRGFGLYYCSDIAAQSYYCFLINAKGSYVIRHRKGDQEWETLKDWTSFSAIRQDEHWNLLTIAKQDNNLYFSINNTYAYYLPFNGEFGTAFGMGLGGDQTVEFDDMVITTGDAVAK
jgi:serine/threonine protein kinase